MAEQIDSDDVVSMDANRSLLGSQTFKVSQFAKGFSDRFGSSVMDGWLGEGVDCEILRVREGWRKGKIRIRFEFVPDEALPNEVPGALVANEEVET